MLLREKQDLRLPAGAKVVSNIFPSSLVLVVSPSRMSGCNKNDAALVALWTLERQT